MARKTASGAGVRTRLLSFARFDIMKTEGDNDLCAHEISCIRMRMDIARCVRRGSACGFYLQWDRRCLRD